MHLQVGSLAGTLGSTTTTPATPKEQVKQLFRVNFGIATTATTTKMKGAVSKVKAFKRIVPLKVGIDTGMSKLIVSFSLLVVTQNFVRFGDFFEFFRGFFVAL
jgi:hypothetical protein